MTATSPCDPRLWRSLSPEKPASGQLQVPAPGHGHGGSRRRRCWEATVTSGQIDPLSASEEADDKIVTLEHPKLGCGTFRRRASPHASRASPAFAETSARGAGVTSRALEGAAQGLGRPRTQQETARPPHQGRPWA